MALGVHVQQQVLKKNYWPSSNVLLKKKSFTPYKRRAKCTVPESVQMCYSEKIFACVLHPRERDRKNCNRPKF